MSKAAIPGPPRDVVGYNGKPPKVSWPGGARIAISLVVNYEEGSELAVGDGAMGFWAALSKVYPETDHQRCWVHKTANILNKLPKSVQLKVKADLHEIWMAEHADYHPPLIGPETHEYD